MKATKTSAIKLIQDCDDLVQWATELRLAADNLEKNYIYYKKNIAENNKDK